METQKAPAIDLSDLGGKQLSGPVMAVDGGHPISLEDLGGVRLGQHQTDATTKLKEAAKAPPTFGDRPSR
jgi:hypothetical protein